MLRFRQKLLGVPYPFTRAEVNPTLFVLLAAQPALDKRRRLE
jgi:hypothetical protein